MPVADGCLHPRCTAARWGRRAAAVVALTGAFGLTGCSGNLAASDPFSDRGPPPAALSLAPTPPSRLTSVKVGLILPLSAGENDGNAGQAMRNAARMALEETRGSNLQLIEEDDGGTGPGAQLAVRQALARGAEIILGPLFSQPVAAATQSAREHRVPIIAFSTDTKVAAPGTYLLSFLPEADVDRVVAYATSRGKRSFVGLIPASPYGTVVEAAFKRAVTRGSGRVVAIEHYTGRDQIAAAVARVAPVAGRADAMFIPDGGDAVTDAVAALAAAAVDTSRLAFIGTQLWDDPKIFADPLLAGGWYPGPDPAGFRAFADRYRARYHEDPPRFATQAYDAVALVAGLVKTQGPRIPENVLTSATGFAGIDGLFRFRDDGTSQRGLAVLQVTPSGGRIVAAAPHGFSVAKK